MCGNRGYTRRLVVVEVVGGNYEKRMGGRFTRSERGVLREKIRRPVRGNKTRFSGTDDGQARRDGFFGARFVINESIVREEHTRRTWPGTRASAEAEPLYGTRIGRYSLRAR